MSEVFSLFRLHSVQPFLFFAGKHLRVLLLSGIAGLSLSSGAAQAAAEDVFLGKIQPQSELTMGRGRSALWTLPDVATQYRPLRPTPALQAAQQAQQEGRFLDALILLEDALKNAPVGADGGDTRAEMNLLRASFLLQGNQPRQVLEILAPLHGNTRYAADALALTAMALLQQGRLQEALDAARRAQELRGGMLPHLALSYALQGSGRLAEARETMRGFNAQISNTSPSQSGALQAVTLAREAELALTLDQPHAARALLVQAQAADAAHPYVVAVSGLVYLIGGQAKEAKAEFETALRRDPQDAKALLGLGLAEIKLGNFPAGQEKLQAAHEADPGSALILTYLGRAQQQSGQTEAAKASWRRAQQADHNDPAPWLYQAQAALQANRPLEAQESLLQAQALTAYRQVYRGENLLREDAQLLQANLAEAQRQLGMDSLAFHTLADASGEKTAVTLRNQADLLQGQRFGESARRSLLLQSLFSERPGKLPATLDVYGDGAGQTGASTPQHGAVSELSAQQASYNNYDELFGSRTTLEADAIAGSKDTQGEQIRLGVGSDTLGLGLAQRQFKSDGFAPFENLDNRIAHGIVQWRPTQSTQAFVSQQTFNSQRGEVFYPADPASGSNALYGDDSKVTRLGLRHSMMENSELRALLSRQQTDQAADYYDFSIPPIYKMSAYGSSSAHSAELQYRRSGASYATQWGVQQFRGQIDYWYSFPYSFGYTQKARQVYAAWQQALSPSWQLDAGLGWGEVENQYDDASQSTRLQHWLPKLGVVYAPDSGTHVRLAAWRGMGFFAAGDATLAPASLAGVLLNRYGDSGNLVHGVSLGGDKQLSPAWLLDAQAQRRKMGIPNIDWESGQQVLFEQQVDEAKLALHWQPEGKPWTVSLAYDHERIRNGSQYLANDSVDQQRLRSSQLALRWFASAQCTANLKWSHNRVTGTQKFNDWSLPPPSYAFEAYQDSFAQLDADLSWQFNRTGSLTAGVRNAADTRFKYLDIDPLSPRFSNGRLVYANLKFAW
ncbi:MAG: hypothetical protein A3F73_07255 [Gallionellales bacterium RIFCSPLOWO2_12_FULL_59_22]|nr:MAG: hypothetical protein A2Z65_07585 [Gallionellales bacterium RIFCSPLOWO2_02_58_13]OGT13703.1 MAG: hypothetical protein A3F73_07255 [Gallionellales bacterium RIFCSPLOWO2_12_FULL_59_22]